MSPQTFIYLLPILTWLLGLYMGYLRWGKPSAPVGGFLTIDGKEWNKMFPMKAEQQIKAAAKFTNKNGQPARVDVSQGVPQWGLSDPSAGVLTPDADGMGMTFVAGSNEVASLIVTCTADADLGDGVKPVVLSGELSILPLEAVGGELVFGAPEDVPAAPAAKK